MLIVTIFSIFLINKTIEKSLATEEQNVVLSIASKPKIDIVLAKARTKTNVSDFENKIVDALAQLNVDSSDVKVTAVETQTVNMEKAFTWNKDVSSSIGSISITNNGQNVVMKGNSNNAGKNAIWIMPTQNQEQKFNFSYSIDFGDSFNAAGMLLRVKQEGNTLTGYMLSFNKSGREWYTTAGNKNGAIWKFTYNIGTNTSNMSKTLVQGLNISTSGILDVTATDTEIVIGGGGMSSSVIYEIPENDQTIGNGFGFFSDHYSHGCSNIGAFSLTNINLETSILKTFDEVLREPDWREESYKFLVNINDVENQELKNNASYGEIATRLINENIYFVSWGKDKNESQFTQLIEANNGNGKFIMNSNYDNSMSETASYIESVVGNQNTKQTVIVNEPIKLSVNPPGIDKNTVDSEWPYGKWKIEHDYTYYENNIGQFAESGKYISNLITSFNKTGRYKIKYRDIPIYPQEVFVHRRPIAQMTMNISDASVTLNSESYDKDKLSTNNGIAEEEWRWRESTSTTWNDGKLTNIDTSKTYIIQLKVKDYQETWSMPISRYITKDRSALPIAEYNITDDILTKYQDITIRNNSYDPAGRQITSSLWEVYKDGEKIYSGATPKTNYLTEGMGTYTMYLTVTNSDNLTSERYGRTFEIGEDTIAPEVVATPITSNWAKSTTVNLKFSDEGGSLVRGYKYAITDSQATPTSWSSEIRKTEDNIVIQTEGRKYLHIIAYDNANNVSNDRILGSYQIDHSGPTIETNGDFNTITTQGIICNIRVVDLLSGLKTVSVNNETLTDLGNSAIQINKNGTYVIRAEDNIGNVSTKELVVNNIYKGCEAGLEHPNYSSSYENCPICDLIEGLQVTKNTEVYNAQERQITYNNTQNATIVEYYNGHTQKPVSVENYEYELKVVYEGMEYKTGITGNFEISKKIVTIENIMAQSREYDGTNKIGLSGGNLVGIEPTDEVGFTLPLMGTISSKDIGEYNVVIPEIVLTGEKAKNYELIQPSEDKLKAMVSPRQLTITELQAVSRPYNHETQIEITKGKLNRLLEDNLDEIGFQLNGGVARSHLAGDQIVDINTIELTNNEKGNYVLISPEPMKVQIMKKEVTVENLTAENRSYDGTDKVHLMGGTLTGIEEEDNVEATLPETGTIPSKDVGEYDVKIPEIILTGKDAENYELVQLAEDDIKVTIAKKELTIDKLKAKNRRYDKTNVVQIEGGELQSVIGEEKVTAMVPKTGVIPNSDIGTWMVEIEPIKLEGEDSPNYMLIQPKPDEILVEISKPAQPNLQLETFVSRVNDKIQEKVNPETEKELDKKSKINTQKTEPMEIRFGDKIEITMKINNKGEGNGYAEKITHHIPKGLKFLEENSTNQENKWKQVDSDTVITEKLNFKSGEENEIKPLEEKQIDNREISLVLEVEEKEALRQSLENETTIEQTDIRQEKIEYKKEENKTVLPITISHTDFTIEKTLQEVTQIEPLGEIHHAIPETNRKFSKIEIPRKNINTTQLQIVYDITITNHGNAKGKVDAVIDYLPKGLQCCFENSTGWKMGNNNCVICEDFGELAANETKTKQLVVSGKASQIIGNKENKVIVLSGQDIDQRWIQQKNKKNIEVSYVDKELFKTNNYSYANLIVSIETGITENYLIWLGVLTCLVIGLGVVAYFVTIQTMQST